MTTTPLTGTTDVNPSTIGQIIGPNGTTSTKDPSTLDKDAFLQLLVAQLKYQSPDHPADTSEMMQQSAQFSELEALQNMQKSQTSLLTWQQSATATGMLGQKITFPSQDGKTDINGTVTGVKLGTDGPILKVGDMEVPLSSVKEVDRAS